MTRSSGPIAVSKIVPEPPTPISRYGSGSASRLAILVTRPDSAWLGLVHGLKSIGIPFVLTTDYRRALEHKAVLVYPMLSGSGLSPEALRAIAAHPRKGGTLIAQNVLGGGLEGVFGFDEAVPSRRRRAMNLADSQPGGLILSDPLERSIRLGLEGNPDTTLGTLGYVNPRGKVLAEFDDGTAALICRSIGPGKAYALGLDVGDFIQRGYNGRGDWLTRSYVNEYEPASDVLLRWLRAVFREAEPDAVTLGTVPDGRALSLVITHDVDARHALENSISYARFEKSRGIRATYFVQTKYVKDWIDIPLFDERSAGYLSELNSLGMEIASHSVSHSLQFGVLPEGSGEERYPGYYPVVVDEKSVTGASVLGELRVSKFLLEQLGPQPVTSFRSGFLRNPRSLPQALLATGYRFSSTATADDSLTHFPFQLNFDRGVSAEVPVFEFPVAIEDTTPISLNELFQRSISLIERIARVGGACIVLIHPNIIGPKLEFEQKLADAVQDKAWIGSLREFGTWWAARNAVSADVLATERGRTVALDLPEEIGGLTVQVPADWTFEASRPKGQARMFSPGIVLLSKASGKVDLFFRLNPSGR